MKFVLSQGEESRTLEWDRMPIADAIECERITGWTYQEWRRALLEDRAQAIAYGWWLAGKRAGVDVGSFAEFLRSDTFDLGALRIEPILTDEERAVVEADESEADEEGPTGPEQAGTPAE